VRIGSAQKQSIKAETSEGVGVLIRVKLCWRQRDLRPGKQPFHAAELIAKIRDGDWEGSLERYVDAAKREGVTHFLFIGREGDSISHAALLPRAALIPVWSEQSRISDQLIHEGRLGNRHKNHARNGLSPTLWLQDRMAPEVTNALWNRPDVVDLMRTGFVPDVDDSMDDLAGFDATLFGSDGAERIQVLRSGVKRDPKVRREVLKRADRRCERSGCGARRNFAGFIDVHHILSAEVSDRIYNCVALCPNCHREAHFAPDRDTINAELLAFALRFQ
jgi:5-methylcytosine-specific restriction protein A